MSYRDSCYYRSISPVLYFSSFKLYIRKNPIENHLIKYHLLKTLLIHCYLQQWLLPSPSYCRFGCPHVIRLATLCWKLPRAHPMWRVSTHISEPNNRTACTTALKIFPDRLGLEPSRPRIHASRSQLFCAFQRFPTTAG